MTQFGIEGILIEGSIKEFRVGLFFSLIFHGVLFYCMLFLATPAWNKMGEPVVYSITLEGGKTLGGISQVPKDDKKSPVAPPKAVSGSPEKSESKQKLVEEDKTAEVSLMEKAEQEKKLAEQKKKEEEEKKLAEKKKADDAAKKAADDKAKAEKQKQQSAAELNKQYQQAMQRYLGESSDAGGKGFGAARLGGSGMGGGVLRPPEFFTYRDLLKRTIKQGWRWFDTSSEIHALAYFEIAKDGTIGNVSIVQGSGNREFDDSVIRAIYKASPVPPPPDNVYEFFEKVRIEFDPSE